MHVLEGLPEALVISRDANGRVAAVRESVEAGFECAGHFYTREQAAAVVRRDQDATVAVSASTPPGGNDDGKGPIDRADARGDQKLGRITDDPVSDGKAGGGLSSSDVSLATLAHVGARDQNRRLACVVSALQREPLSAHEPRDVR